MAILQKNNTAGSFSKGLSYPFRAAGFIWHHPRLYRYIIIPFLINIIVFCASVYLGLNFLGEIVNQYIPLGDAWYWLFLNYFLWAAAILITMVLVFFLFTFWPFLVFFFFTLWLFFWI